MDNNTENFEETIYPSETEDIQDIEKSLKGRISEIRNPKVKDLLDKFIREMRHGSLLKGRNLINIQTLREELEEEMKDSNLEDLKLVQLLKNYIKEQENLFINQTEEIDTYKRYLLELLKIWDNLEIKENKERPAKAALEKLKSLIEKFNQERMSENPNDIFLDECKEEAIKLGSVLGERRVKDVFERYTKQSEKVPEGEEDD